MALYWMPGGLKIVMRKYTLDIPLVIVFGLACNVLSDQVAAQPTRAGISLEAEVCQYKIKKQDLRGLDQDSFWRFSNRCASYIWEAGISKYGFNPETERWWDLHISSYMAASVKEKASLWCAKTKLHKYPATSLTEKNLLTEILPRAVERWKIKSNSYELISVDDASVWVSNDCLAFPLAGLSMENTLKVIKELKLSFDYVNGDHYLPICKAEKVADGKKWHLRTECRGNGVEYAASNNPSSWTSIYCSDNFKNCLIDKKEVDTTPLPEGEPGV